VSIAISGQIGNGLGANQLVTGAPTAWPILNAAGSSATDPGIAQALCDAGGNWTVSNLPNNTNCTITTPEGTSAGVTPNVNGGYTLAALQSGSGWSAGGAR
jgi:hypothetical protein